MISDASGRRLYLTDEERETFLKSAFRQPGEIRSFCETLHYTGCRISEALSLTAAQIDLDDGTVTVETLKKRRSGVFRTIPVPASYLNTIELVHHVRSSRTPSRPLWRWSRATAWRYVKAVMEQARITPGPHRTPKGLRHGYGINGISSGVPLNMLSKWMGHSTIEITSIYANAVGAEQRRLNDAMWRARSTQTTQ